MNTPEIVGFISGLFLIYGYIPYAIDIFKKNTRPSRVSWFIWAFSVTLLLFEVKRRELMKQFGCPSQMLLAASLFLSFLSGEVWADGDSLTKSRWEYVC